MPRNLPDDIWLEIIKMRPFRHLDDRNFLHNLALACRRLHLITTPVLYRCLSFCVNFDDGEDRPELAMIGLIRDLTRARSLLQSPQLLRHVQRLNLEQWDVYASREDISAEYFFPGYDFDPEYDFDQPAVDTTDARNMIWVIYHLITRLVLHMPRLQELELVESPMTPLLFAAMSSRPSLTSLILSLDDTAEIHEESCPIDLPITLPIQKFKYDYLWADTRTAGFLSHILAGCIMNLNTFSITSVHLPLVLSLIKRRTLPLQTLQVKFDFPARISYEDPVALWDILRATPELRTLIIRGSQVDHSPPDDLCDRLCNLFRLCASLKAIHRLTQGKEFDAIEVNKISGISGLSVAQIIPCSPTHLRDLSLHRVSPKTQNELDIFISSFDVFQCLESLSINYHFPGDPATDADFHKSWNVIKDLWQKLKRLHRFKLSGAFGFRLPYEAYGIEVACPLDVNVEPLSRGHPTLEQIYVSFFRRSLWEWDSNNGWVSMQWSYTAWHDAEWSDV